MRRWAYETYTEQSDMLANLASSYQMTMIRQSGAVCYRNCHHKTAILHVANSEVDRALGRVVWRALSYLEGDH